MNMQQMDQRNDAELLTEFAAKGSHAAFALLDVTQAVFIVLAGDAKKHASSPSVNG